MARPGRHLHKLLGAILCLFSGESSGTAAVPDIESVLDQHRASLGLIQSLTCRIEFRGASRVTSAEYFRSGQDVYIKETVKQGVGEILVKGAVVRTIATAPDPSSGGHSGGGIRADDGKEISECDVAARALLTVLEPNGVRYVPFAQIVTEASKVSPPREAVLGGKQVVAVDLILDRPGIIKGTWNATVYFDPAVNWMIVGTDHSISPTKERRILRMARAREMKEVRPGLFLPVKIELLLVENGGPAQPQWMTTISDLRVNEKVPESTFTLRYAQGLRIMDRTQNAMYKVNSRGERITPLQLLQSGDIANERRGRDVINAPTMVEPPSRTRSLVGAGLGIIVLGLFLKVVRTYRRRPAEASPSS